MKLIDLMKKHTDQNRLEIRDKLRSAVNNSSDKATFNTTKEAQKQAALYKKERYTKSCILNRI
jgi:hypothetical protein